VQYVAVGGAITASLFAISRGLIIEPPAALTKSVEAAAEWLMRRLGTMAKPAQ
jgi:hypothetical protein